MKQPSKESVTRGFYKQIDGVWHKRCTGPAHDEPTYLPATDKYFYKRAASARDGEFLSRCRLCQNWARVKSPGSERGLIETDKVLHFYQEAVNRVGRAELSRRTGLSIESISNILSGKRQHVRKGNFKLVLLELISMRRKNEYHSNASLRLADKKRANKKREAIRAMARDIVLHDQEAHLDKIRPVKPDKPDQAWWHDTGQGWLPRWGEEMLGSDF